MNATGVNPEQREVLVFMGTDMSDMRVLLTDEQIEKLYLAVLRERVEAAS